MHTASDKMLLRERAGSQSPGCIISSSHGLTCLVVQVVVSYWAVREYSLNDV